jgi:hypothetical protein
VTGWSTGSGTDFDYATIKYVQGATPDTHAYIDRDANSIAHGDADGHVNSYTRQRKQHQRSNPPRLRRLRDGNPNRHTHVHTETASHATAA